MRRLPSVVAAVTAASLVLLVAPALAAASTPRSFTATPGLVRAGQEVKASDARTAGTTEPPVLDPGTVESAPARQAFGPRQDASTAVTFGLLAGIALLIASLGIARRRD